MFFTGDARPAALRVIRRALVRGGYLLMPLMPVVPEPQETHAAPATRGLLLARLAYPRWGIRWDDPAEVRSEVESAGFEFVREIPNPRTPYLLFRAP
jgi:hypothetical protein